MNDIVLLEGIFENGYGFIAKQVMQDRNICIGAKGLYSYICSFSGKGESAFPSRSKITYDLGISNDTLGKYMKQLIEHGYLTVTQKKQNGKFSHNVYKINIIKKPCPKISDTENSVPDNSVPEELDTNNNSSTNNNINNKESKKAKHKSTMVDIGKIPPIDSQSEEPKKPKRTRKPKEDNRTYDDILNNEIQDEILKNCFKEFIKMRKMIKAPLTNYALELAIKEARKLAPGDIKKQAEIVNQSVAKSWKGLFPLKEETKKQNESFNQRTYSQEEFNGMYANKGMYGNKRRVEAAAYDNL